MQCLSRFFGTKHNIYVNRQKKLLTKTKYGVIIQKQAQDMVSASITLVHNYIKSRKRKGAGL